jgi:hypothetical protein
MFCIRSVVASKKQEHYIFGLKHAERLLSSLRPCVSAFSPPEPEPKCEYRPYTASVVSNCRWIVILRSRECEPFRHPDFKYECLYPPPPGDRHHLILLLTSELAHSCELFYQPGNVFLWGNGAWKRPHKVCCLRSYTFLSFPQLWFMLWETGGKGFFCYVHFYDATNAKC